MLLSLNPLISSVILSIPFISFFGMGTEKSVFQTSNWMLASFSSVSVWTCVSQEPVFNFSRALMVMNDGSRHSGVFNIPHLVLASPGFPIKKLRD